MAVSQVPTPDEGSAVEASLQADRIAGAVPSVRSGDVSRGLSKPAFRPQLAKGMWFLGGASLVAGTPVALASHAPGVFAVLLSLAAIHLLAGGLLRWTSLEARFALLPLAVGTPVMFALIAQLTGGVESLAFRGLFLVPVLGALMLRGDLLLPSVTALSTLLAGIALLWRSPSGPEDAASWIVLLAVSCGAAIFAAFQYRNLLAAETAGLQARNDALARLARSEREVAFQSQKRQEETSHALRQLNSAHAELKKVHERAVSQEKLAAIGTLAAGVAHEINNPMSFVTSNVGQLLADLRKLPSLPAVLREYADEVLPETLEGIRRVNSIVADARRPPAPPRRAHQDRAGRDERGHERRAGGSRAGLRQGLHEARGRNRGGVHQRHGDWNVSRDAGEAVRSILHDQTRRPGNGTGPFGVARDHRGPWGPHRGGQRARPRKLLHPPPAADSAGRVGVRGPRRSTVILEDRPSQRYFSPAASIKAQPARNATPPKGVTAPQARVPVSASR